ncbi:hypothetical protein [Otariodibacter oris]|uniref:Uncharacterized protein n=1 Tax=Otariodibacter oris TaxID=1032623 RepID=A0A420XIT7_9PAST|nr:hypothetical protein [Otariodibacter oris]QGM80681.1 hypothetical protein A6A10_04315 [Otariodibacter oris]RKR77156.1 hypothetical protein DES31_0481 [Otariodibacter oris]
MKAKEFRVTSTVNSIYPQDAAEFINKTVMESIGITAFSPKEEEYIFSTLENEINSCDPDIIPFLKIEVEEVEFEDE